MPTITEKLTIATRVSPLAKWQAEYVKTQLQAHHPSLQVDLLCLSTKGDRVLDRSLAKIGGKGLFTKELEDALLNGKADLAVHSMKDVPAELPLGLELAVICQRENPFDAFVSPGFDLLDDLPPQAVVGTSSLRRQAQLLAYRPDLRVKSLRGNVGTRLAKLDAKEYDAIILAAAGLLRLKLGDRIKQTLPSSICLPAVAQGAVGIEIRQDDEITRQFISPLAHSQTGLCVRAERAFNAHLQGSCETPIAVHAILEGDTITIEGLVANEAGRQVIRDTESGSRMEPEKVGITLANTLLKQGAADLLPHIVGR